MNPSESFQNQESAQAYYFFMKVGFSNSLLQFADKLGGLWIGFDDVEIPRVDDNGLCNRKKEKLDLLYATMASSIKWRSHVKIVTYSNDAMLIWKPIDDLRILKTTDGNLDWNNPALYSRFPKQWHDWVKSKLGGIGSKAFFEQHFGPNGWKLLPAQIETVISRENLIAPIDSLAVWQNFSRNTFQPMFTLTGNPNLKEIDWLNNVKDLPAFALTDLEKPKEGLFGKFLRVYLDHKREPTKTIALNGLNNDQKQKTVLAILNPAQVETAAMLLCRDLGLTIDVGIGKGLDVVDVKATARHLDSFERKEKTKNVVSALEKLGVQFSDQLRHSILSTATIRIQCKAMSGIKAEGTVLIVEPCLSAGSQVVDRLALEQIITSQEPLLEFREWVKLLSYDLSAV